MNSKTMPELTQLAYKSTGFNTGDITLSQPFTNFRDVCVFCGDDGLHFLYATIINSQILNYILGTLNKTFNFDGGGDLYYRIKPYSNGSSTTLWASAGENANIMGVYGVTYKS